jgi:hypothetical protein
MLNDGLRSEGKHRDTGRLRYKIVPVVELRGKWFSYSDGPSI